MDQARRRRSAASAAATRRRLQSLLALAGEYIKYLFMKRGRLLCKVARRSLALILSSSSGVHGRHSSGGKRCLAPASSAPWPPCALAEREFSCSNSPSPAFLAAMRLRSRLRRGATSSCFGCGSSPPAVTETDQAAELQDYEEEEVDWWWARGNLEVDVDYRAEEFINMFYEQLRAQR